MSQKKYISLSSLETFLKKLPEKFSPLEHKHKLEDIKDYQIDNALSNSSENPVQNKIINEEFEAVSDAMGALELAIDNKAKVVIQDTPPNDTNAIWIDLADNNADELNIVKTVNGLEPDENGNIQLADAPTFTISGTTLIISNVIVKQQPIAYAVYSETDNSLTFYKTTDVIIEGSTYNDKVATAVYTGIETEVFGIDYNTGESHIPWYEYAQYIKKVEVKDTIAPVSTADWFSGFESCTSMDLAKLNTSDVTDMSEMFDDCEELTELDLSNFNTQNVTVMRRMFRDCNSLKSIIFPENFGAAATDMEQMFNNCKALTELDLSNFSTQNVENMEWMFAWCQALTSLDFPSSFNTQNVIYMEKMFYECRALKSITFGSGWNTSNVMIMSSMFDCCTALPSIDLSNWNTQNVTNMRCMFMYCEELTSVGDISGWNTQNVTDMNSMFAACSKLTANCRNWNVNKVTDHEDFKTFANGVIAPTWAA